MEMVSVRKEDEKKSEKEKRRREEDQCSEFNENPKEITLPEA